MSQPRLYEYLRVWCVRALPKSILKQISLDLGPLTENDEFIHGIEELLYITHGQRREMLDKAKHQRFIDSLFPRRNVSWKIAHLFLLLEEMQTQSRCCQKWWCPNYKVHWPAPSAAADPNPNDRERCFTIDGLICYFENHGAKNAAKKMLDLREEIKHNFYWHHAGQFAKLLINDFLSTLSLLPQRSSRLTILIDWNTLTNDEVLTVIRAAWSRNIRNIFVIPQCPLANFHEWQEFSEQQIAETGAGQPLVVGLSMAEGAVVEEENQDPRMLIRQHILLSAQKYKVELIAVRDLGAEHLIFNNGNVDDDNDMEEADDDDHDEVADGEGDEPIPEGQEEFLALLRYGTFDISSDTGREELVMAFQSCEYLIQHAPV